MVTFIATCFLSSPFHIPESQSGFIPPVLFNNRLYIIKEKFLYEVLNKIGLYQKFNMFVRENGYNVVGKWLKNNKLLNAEFLEVVSYYDIESFNIRKIKNYSYFYKNHNMMPTIPEKYVKNLLKKIFIHKYLKSRNDTFNMYVYNNLLVAKHELKSVNNKINYNNRKNFYINNIFKILIDNFLNINNDANLFKDLQLIENLNIKIESGLTQHDLGLYKAGNPVSCKNFRYTLSNISYHECLKANTEFMLAFESSDTIYDKTFIDCLLENLNTYTEDKLLFDMNYVSKINCLSNEGYAVERNVREPVFSGNYPKTMLLKEKKTEYKLPALINVNFNAIKNSNLYFCPDNLINNTVLALNLDTYNLDNLNLLLFNKKQKIESDIVQFSVENNLIPYYEIGNYANIFVDYYIKQ